jgi:hypothetical protein
MWGALSDEKTGLPFTIAAGLASAVILESEFESHGIWNHIFTCMWVRMTHDGL